MGHVSAKKVILLKQERLLSFCIFLSPSPLHALFFPADRNFANFPFQIRSLQKGNKKILLGLILFVLSLCLFCPLPILPYLVYCPVLPVLLPLLCSLPQAIARETLDCVFPAIFIGRLLSSSSSRLPSLLLGGSSILSRISLDVTWSSVIG